MTLLSNPSIGIVLATLLTAWAYDKNIKLRNEHEAFEQNILNRRRLAAQKEKNVEQDDLSVNAQSK